MPDCMYVCVCRGPQRLEEASQPLDLELWTVSATMWMFGTKPSTSSARTFGSLSLSNFPSLNAKI